MTTFATIVLFEVWLTYACRRLGRWLVDRMTDAELRRTFDEDR